MGHQKQEERKMDVRHPRMAWPIGVVFFAVVVSLAPATRADLSPREYRRMQREAPEVVKIEVLKVHERPVREREREFEISVEAKIRHIERTSTRLHDGELIRIVYTHHRREDSRPGAGEPPVLQRGTEYPAFLTKVEGERLFKPAAGEYSFERLAEERR
jgi:hypothetical protein